jgi:hypothetical protein
LASVAACEARDADQVAKADRGNPDVHLCGPNAQRVRDSQLQALDLTRCLEMGRLDLFTDW